MKIHETAKSRSPEDLTPATVIGFLCVVVVVLLSLADLGKHPGFRLLPFYLIIIAVGARWADRWLVIIAVVLCALTGMVGELLVATRSSSMLEVCWNAALQGVLCGFVFVTVDRYRQMKRNLEQQVAQRTQLLTNEIAERQVMEEQLQKSLQQFRQFAENISDVLWLRNVGETRMGYASPAYEAIWGRSCKELYLSEHSWTNSIHQEDRERVLAAMATKQVTGEYNEEYRVVRPDGTLRWIRERSYPIRAASGAVVRIIGIAEDVTDRRRLEREIMDISDREQVRIGQELHDSLCQKLVTLAFDHGRLENELASRSATEVKAVREMMAFVDDLISESRAIARGLFPVQMEGDGLLNALGELAANISGRFSIECKLTSVQAELVRNTAVAAQLYRIVQEAVNNAVKHARCKTIRITANITKTRIELSVADDGVGLKSGRKGGMGLHIMEYRARTVGGTLTVERKGASGTMIACSAPQELT